MQVVDRIYCIFQSTMYDILSMPANA